MSGTQSTDTCSATESARPAASHRLERSVAENALAVALRQLSMLNHGLIATSVNTSVCRIAGSVLRFSPQANHPNAAAAEVRPHQTRPHQHRALE